jgi:hypothetical protein
VSPNDNFRRELNNVFDDVSGAPSPALKDRVRSAVAEAPESRSIYWVAAVAAILVTALIVGVLFVANPLRRPTGLVGPGPTPSPSATASPTPTTSPTPTQATLPPFICSADTLQPTHPTHLPTAYISDVNTGAHQGEGYDRLVVTFGNGMPDAGVEITPQSTASFDGAPSGAKTNLKGSHGINVVIRGADLHTSYTGPTDIVPKGYTGLAEVARVQDFEGVVQLGLGINVPPCYRAFYLTGPDRLVIDVQTAS